MGLIGWIIFAAIIIYLAIGIVVSVLANIPTAGDRPRIRDYVKIAVGWLPGLVLSRKRR